VPFLAAVVDGTLVPGLSSGATSLDCAEILKDVDCRVESGMRRNVMPRHLKRGVDASAIKAADAKVREMVEQILADVDAHKSFRSWRWEEGSG
jgi:cytidylate kinase